MVAHDMSYDEVLRSVLDAFVDALNRGGGRLKLIDAKPSLAAAQTAAARLGIKLAEA
jgi:hypothetical protein